MEKAEELGVPGVPKKGRGRKRTRGGEEKTEIAESSAGSGTEGVRKGQGFREVKQ